MKAAAYIRTGKTIMGPDGKHSFKTVNLAKKESRRIQIKSDGALGRGILRAIRS